MSPPTLAGTMAYDRDSDVHQRHPVSAARQAD